MKLITLLNPEGEITHLINTDNVGMVEVRENILVGVDEPPFEVVIHVGIGSRADQIVIAKHHGRDRAYATIKSLSGQLGGRTD